MTATAASTVPFEDVHEYDGAYFYVVPNEETMLWRELVKGLPINRAAGICSSGEVGFFAMLPTVRKELVLVDHSYRSLSIAMLKYLLIREKGWQEAHRLFTSRDLKELRAAFEELKARLPKKTEDAYQRTLESAGEYAYGSTSFVGRNSLHVNPLLNKEWNILPTKLIATASKKFDKVTFLHGDMTDLIAKGPFDLFYISNAIDHQRRASKGSRDSWLDPDDTVKQQFLSEITKVVKPGGYVIAADVKGWRLDQKDVFEKAGWTDVKTVQSEKTSWRHRLFQTPKEVVEKVEVVAA